MSPVIASRTKETFNFSGTNRITIRFARAATRSNVFETKADLETRDALEVCARNFLWKWEKVLLEHAKWDGYFNSYRLRVRRRRRDDYENPRNCNNVTSVDNEGFTLLFALKQRRHAATIQVCRMAVFGGKTTHYRPLKWKICVIEATVRGRKPKPIQQQIAEGDPRKHGVKKLEKRLGATPRAEHGLPDAPAHLGEVAREIWQLWREELEKMQLDFRPDQVMLEGACVWYERGRQADEKILKHGIIIAEPIMDRFGRPTGGTRVKTNPCITTSNLAWRNVRSFCSEFGLSPVSRTRLSIKEQGDSQADLMKLLSAPREKKQTTRVQ